MPIVRVKARQIYDCRGYPTLEVDVIKRSRATFRAGVPNHDSRAMHGGQGMDKAAQTVDRALHAVTKVIGPALVKKKLDITNQGDVDHFLQKIADEHDLSTHAIAGVSMAVCRAGAAKQEVQLYQHIAAMVGTRAVYLPVPVFNVINGGRLAGNSLGMAEFLLLPKGARSFQAAMRMGSECYQCLRQIVRERNTGTTTNPLAVGDEGGFVSNISTAKEALDLMRRATAKAGLTEAVKFGIAAGAAEFYRDRRYDLNYKNPWAAASCPLSNPTYSTITSITITRGILTAQGLLKTYTELINGYPIVTLEEPFHPKDTYLTELKSFRFTQIVTDQLPPLFPSLSVPVEHLPALEKVLATIAGNRLPTISNLSLRRQLQPAASRVKERAACFLLKPFRPGIATVTDAVDACDRARKTGWSLMVSHQCGETEDTFLADLAVGLQAEYIKAGAPCRSERTAKYNQVIRIEEHMGMTAKYIGISL